MPSIPSDDAIKEDLNFKPADAREIGREVRFRIGVVNAYDYTMPGGPISSHARCATGRTTADRRLANPR